MPKGKGIVDLTGQKISKLLVLGYSHRDERGVHFFDCQCDCGTISKVQYRYLMTNRGFQKSCGCARREYNESRPDKFKDLTGQRFHRLTVLGFNKKELVATQNGHTESSWRYYWNCLCDCGTELVVLGNSLLSGHTKSCGCQKIDSAKARLDDITGQKFNRLTVIDFSHFDSGGAVWNCVCDCGNEAKVRGTHLRSGYTKSCGCYGAERRLEGITIHGLSSSRTYGIWSGMMRRCYQEYTFEYKSYGGRGIKVCERWHDVKNFIEDMGDAPSSDYSLDRVDNDGDYSPENCRWATRKEQARNTRRNVNITFNGVTKCMIEWSEYLGLSTSAIKYRLNHGWTADQILFTPSKYPKGMGYFLTDDGVVDLDWNVIWNSNF